MLHLTTIIKVMKKKNITMDDLAGMAKREFDEIHKKLGKLDTLEKNDQVILKRLEGVVYRTEFERLEIRVKELEDLLAINGKKS